MQSINDGKLEVVALYSSFHMAQLQIGLSKPHRIGQANTVKVCFNDPKDFFVPIVYHKYYYCLDKIIAVLCYAS